MIVLPAPPLSASEAARRLAGVGGAVWSRSPRRDHLHDVVNHLAAGPIEVVQGDDVDELAAAWAAVRGRWGCETPDVPVAFGYLSYGLGARFVGGRQRTQELSDWPSLSFRFHDAVLEVAEGGASRVLAMNPAAGHRLLARLAKPPARLPEQELQGPLRALDSPEDFIESVERVRAYLLAGDVYQVNLARRLEAPLVDLGSELRLHRGLALALALAGRAPAPFGIWLGPLAGGAPRALVGNSPERFLRLTPDGRLETAPIKGTRRRSDEVDADDPMVKALQNSSKDRAEHDMIVDLERNDLGRVCEVGSVRVREHVRVLHLPTVHHLVSVVEGRLRPDVDLPRLLAATFPGGSITGAPKRRAVEIISELEPAERGPYTGATGWLGAAGDLDLAVAIRTAALSDRKLTLWVGGGLVVDSTPADELAETDAKAQAFARLWQGAP